MTASSSGRPAATWSVHELDRIAVARELEIAVRRADGTQRRWTPIWVVRAEDRVYVRSWYRRDTGWFGEAVRVRRARVRVPGLEVDVAIEDVGEGSPALREAVDAAYRCTYGAGAESMVAHPAAATTLRLDPRR